jgi:fucose 4-O-acetylase-like acetyltransferase
MTATSLTEERDGIAERDGTLDCLKGLAIILVVAGHTAQESTPDFDNLFAFRAIYAFHMPLFMFVAGMVIAVSLRKVMPVGQLPATAWLVADGVRKRVGRLLVPFFAWGLVALLYPGHPGETLGSWLEKLVRAPDIGLWFLLVLFDCYLVMAPCLILAAALLAAGGRDGHGAKLRFLILAASLVLGWIALELVPHGFGPNGLGLALARDYFPFVAMGLLYQMFIPRGPALPLRLGAAIAFVLLMPFWYRVDGFPSLALPHDHLGAVANLVLRDGMALGGIAITIEVAHLIERHGHALIRHTIGLCGRRSLEIYALHFNLLEYRPAIVAPIVLSLIVALVLRNVPLLGAVLFGQVPLWQRQIWHRLTGRADGTGGEILGAQRTSP